MPPLTRPTIVIAYGGSGRSWLTLVSHRLLAIERHRALHERRLLQFWLVNGDPAHPISGVVDLDHRDERLMKDLLDRARLDQHRIQVQGVELHEVVIVDRPSLWLADAAVSLELQSSLDTIRAAATGGSLRTDFELRWWTLIDAVTGASEANDPQRLVSRAFLNTSLPRRSFLVDRLSAANGVVQHAQADLALAEVATIALHSALLAPEPAGGELDLVEFLNSPQETGCVTPLSVGTLRHPASVFEESAAEALLASLAVGPDEQSREYLNSIGGSAPRVPDLIDSSGAPGGDSARLFDQRLGDSLLGYFARMLEHREPVIATLELEQARSALRRVAVGTAYGLGSFASFAMAPLPDMDATQWVLGTLGLLSLAGLAAVAVRRRTGGDIRGPVGTDMDPPSEHHILEWRRTLDSLEKVTSWWITHCRRVREEPARMTRWQPVSSDEAYATWTVLPASFGANSPRAARTTYERLLARLAAMVRLNADDPAVLWKNEALAMTRGMTDLRPQELESRLHDALEAFRREWQGSLRALSLLAPVASADPVAHVLWLTPDPAAVVDVITPLEEGVSGRPPVILRSESPHRTVRLALGHDVPYEQLSTLAALR